MRRSGAVAAAVASSGLAIACANILGIETLTKAVQEAGPAEDAYVAPDAASDLCLADPGPSQPDASDGTPLGAAWLVVDQIDFGTDDQAPGLNLDHKCTLSDGMGTTCGFPGTTGLFKYTTDEANGVDNAGRHGLDFGVLGGQSISAGLTAQVKSRASSFAFRVDEYDGRPDDPAITLSVVSVNGDGSGKWSADVLSTGGGLDMAPKSSKAWVAGGKLVAFFKLDLALPVRVPASGGALMLLRDTVVTADVTTAAAGAQVVALANGILGARWKAVDAIAQLGNLVIPPNKPACSSIQSFMCKLPDIASDPAQDGTAFECDAFSVGFGFHAAPSAIGNPSDGGPISMATTCVCP